MSDWSHLPNAVHIDRVIQSIKSHPEVWSLPRGWDIAWSAAYDAARGAAWGAARGAAWEAAWDAAWDAAWIAARAAARGSILALIAYDDAAKYLDMPSDQLKMWAILSEDPAAVLLLPAAIVCEKISELETA